MKKIKKISIILIFIFTVGVIATLIVNNNKIELKETSNEKKSGMLSFMIEDGNGSYKEASDNAWPTADNYIFNETLSKCERGSKLKYDSSTKKVQVIASGSDKCYVYFDYAKLTDYILKDYSKDGDSNIYYHDGEGSYTNSNLEAGDLSYRYAGAFDDVNNWVCFGANVSNCPDDNLYRIIGFFKNAEGKYEIKLIKADYASTNLLGNGKIYPSGTIDYNVNGSFAAFVNKNSKDIEFNDAFVHRYRGNLSEIGTYTYQGYSSEIEKNDWPTSLLNTIHLNHNFINTLKKKYQDKIVDYKWHYIGSNWANITTGSILTTFNYEVGKNADKTLTNPTKIGLMYISDYFYGASPNNWNLVPYAGNVNYVYGEPDEEGIPSGSYPGNKDTDDYRDAIDENWMYMGLWEWTITQRTDQPDIVYDIHASGIVHNRTGLSESCVIRPVFYLKDNVKVASGNGTKTNPYIIN